MFIEELKFTALVLTLVIGILMIMSIMYVCASSIRISRNNKNKNFKTVIRGIILIAMTLAFVFGIWILIL